MNTFHNFGIFILALSFVFYSCNESGCTDITANNYNSEADQDDNSCLYNNTLTIQFRLVNGEQAFSKYDTVHNQDYSFRLQNLKFYLSNLQLQSNDGIKHLSDVHLFNIDNTASQSLTFEVEEGMYNGLEFDLGLNSEQNSTTPADYALDHPLGLNQNTFWAMDPASYIFVLMEGKMDTTNGDNFYPSTYHLAHNDLLKNINLTKSIDLLTESSNSLVINLDISQIFDQVDLSRELPHQSTNSPFAQLLMTNFSSGFEIQ